MASRVPALSRSHLQWRYSVTRSSWDRAWERVTAISRCGVCTVLHKPAVFWGNAEDCRGRSRLTTDTNVSQTALFEHFVGLRNTVLFVGGLTMLVITSPRLMGIVLAIIGLVVLPAVFFGRRVRKLSRASQDRIADSSAIAGEILNAIPVVQSFTQQGYESRRFGNANESAFQTSIRRTRARALLTAFVIIGVFASLLMASTRAASVIAGLSLAAFGSVVRDDCGVSVAVLAECGARSCALPARRSGCRAAAHVSNISDP